MKKLLILLALGAIIAPVLVFSGFSDTTSAIPHMINYQGLLTDDEGNPLTGTYNITFKIYNDSTGGMEKWTEAHSDVPVTNGSFNVILGSVNPIDLPFTEDYWLDITVGEEHMPSRLRFTSVGYCYRAVVADSALKAASAVGGGGWVDDGTVVRLETNTDNVGIGTGDCFGKLTIEQGRGDWISLRASQNNNTWSIHNPANADRLEVGFHDDQEHWGLFVIKNNGNVGIGTTSPSEKLTVVKGSDSYVTGLKLHNRNNPSGNYRHGVGISFQLSHDYQHYKKAEIRAVATSDYANDIALTFWSGGSTADDHRERMRIAHNGNVGIGTVAPQSKLDVDGTTRTKVLTITGGSDLAEPFPISYSSELPAGSAVIIDEENPGHLTLSQQPYDRRVAGIVSGAGGINSGLTLSQQGVMEGDQNIALSGRVYALATASNGIIKPGDLLTTSEIPGHLMKVKDFDRAQGAIVGKAMGALEEGEGLVLVLITLQ